MEQVFVVRRDEFFDGNWPQGFVPLTQGDGQPLVTEFERRGFFADRPEAEETPAWKQLIPYCLVFRPNELFCVQRLKKGGEGRLHGKWSVGFGGHINPVDREPVAARGGLVRDALQRELSEELQLPPLETNKPQFLGLLNDDQTEVGRVHVGVVFLLTLPSEAPVAVREVSVLRGQFAPLTELPYGSETPDPRLVERGNVWHDAKAFESWSAIMLEARPWQLAGVTRGSKTVAENREEAQDG